MHTPSPLLTLRALFLARSESSVRTDSKVLRSLGLSAITHMQESEQALALLEKQSAVAGAKEVENIKPVDIVLCDEHSSDAPASVFLYRLAKHEQLRAQPVLVLTASPKSSRALRSAGVYVLERPYTPTELARMLIKAMSSSRRILHSDAFEKAAENKNLTLTKTPRPKPSSVAPLTTTSDWYGKGLAALQNNQLHEAEHAFTRVLDRQEDHIDASLGLARVYRLQGDANSSCRFLLRAAAASLRQGDKMRSVQIASLLPAVMRSSIFLHEALARLQEGEFKAAALGFLDADKDGAEMPLHHLISRACLRTEEPEESMRKLCNAFTSMGYVVTAGKLRQRLLAYPEFTPREPHSWLDAYPKLKEAVNVVSYAAWAWKHARA